MRADRRHLTLLQGTREGFPEVTKGSVEEATPNHRSVSPEKASEWAGVNQEAKREGKCVPTEKRAHAKTARAGQVVSMARAQHSTGRSVW